MSKFYLLNSVALAGATFRPGDLIDERYRPVAEIRAAGGSLWPSTDLTVAAAAETAQKRRLQGADDAEVGMLMLSSVMVSVLDQEIEPNVVTYQPGAHSVIELAALLLAGPSQKVVRFAPGDHVFDGTLTLSDAHSGARLLGAVSPSGKPLARWIWGGVAPSPSLADDPSNAFIVIWGTIDTTHVDSYPQTTAIATDQTIFLHAPVTTPAGSWIVLEGSDSAGDDEYQGSMAGAEFLHELVRVASAVNASATVPLMWPLIQHHIAGPADQYGTPVTAKGVRPAVDVRIEGFEFVIPDATYIACGISVLYGYGVSASHITGGDFTRAMLHAVGSQSFELRDLHDKGGGHSIVRLDSCQRFNVSEVTGEPGVRRFQPYGVPRAKLYFRRRCTEGVVTNFNVCHGVMGLLTWGVHQMMVTDGIVSDMDGTIIMPSSIAGGGGRDDDIGSIFGVGIDTGAPFVGAPSANPPGNADFGVGLILDNVVFVDCYDTCSGAAGQSGLPPRSGSAFAVSWHDIKHSSIGNVQILNLGVSGSYGGNPDGIRRNHNGLLMSDCSGNVDSVTIRGCAWPLFFLGVANDLEIRSIWIDSTPGFGSNSSFIEVGVAMLPRIQRLKCAAAVTLFPDIDFATVGVTDYSSPFVQEWNTNGTIGRDVTVAIAAGTLTDQSGSPAAGNVAVLTGTGAVTGGRNVVAPAASDPGRAVLVMQGGTGVLFVALGGGSAVVDSAVNPGDILRCSGVNQLLTVDNSAVAPVAKYRALSKTIAAGIVLVEPY